MVQPRYESRVVESGQRGVLEEEVLYPDGERRDVMFVSAPCGGGVEAYTDTQARWVAGSNRWRTVVWCVSATSMGDGVEWGDISGVVDVARFKLLGRINRFNMVRSAVSFRGTSGECVRIGGGAETNVRERVAERVQDIVDDEREVRVIEDGEYDSEAVVNRFVDAGGGVRVEQPAEVRSEYWREVAGAVMDAVNQEWIERIG